MRVSPLCSASCLSAFDKIPNMVNILTIDSVFCFFCLFGSSLDKPVNRHWGFYFTAHVLWGYALISCEMAEAIQVRNIEGRGSFLLVFCQLEIVYVALEMLKGLKMK